MAKAKKKVAKKKVSAKKAATNKTTKKKVVKKAASKKKAAKVSASKKSAKKVSKKKVLAKKAVTKPKKKVEKVFKAETVKKAKAKEALVKKAETYPIPELELTKQELVLAMKKDPQLAQWVKFYRKAAKLKVSDYNMGRKFDEKTALRHKVLGWGYVISNVNDRLEVLFKDGIKFLISNYK